MVTPIYKYIIRIGSDAAADHVVYPVVKDDVSIEYAKESGQMFFRRQLSGNIDFINEDYDLIMAQTFGTWFYFYIMQSNNNGVSWGYAWVGRFTITDCTVSVDDKRIRVKPAVYDLYNEVLAGYEKEFDLIKLTPAMQKVMVRKRPCIQIYTDGDDILTNVVGDISFEQEVDFPNVEDRDRYLRERCIFTTIRSYTEMNFGTVPEAYESAFAAPFTGIVNESGSRLTNTPNLVYIEYFEFIENQYEDFEYWVYHNGYRIYEVSSGNVLWKFEQQAAGNYLPLPTEVTFAEVVEGLGSIVGTSTSQTIYGRILLNVENYGDQPTYDLGTDDLVADNKNYHKAVGFRDDSLLVQTSAYSTTPTEWGKKDNGTYFCPPDNLHDYVPVGRSTWVNTSIWFKLDEVSTKIDLDGSYAYFINDCYPLAAAIQAILNEIAPSVTFQETTAYSQFLYSGSDPIGGRNNRILITPKSNVIYGEYTVPAQKAPVTLRTLLDFLKNTYQCYWFIEAGNKLRVEHIEYFRRGGTYSGTPSVGFDLTNLEVRRSGKKWAFGANTYEFDKSEMPERYEFGWMDDDVTLPFKGKPIDVVSPYVQEGKIEDVNVSQFTTDIDFMLLNPSAISPDGFVAMTVVQADAINGFTQCVALDGQQYTNLVPIASFVQNQSAVLRWVGSGTGTVTIVFYKGGDRVISSYDKELPFAEEYKTISIPADTTAIGFKITGSNTRTVSVISLKKSSGDDVQVPVVDGYIDGKEYRLQNGYLSFYYLQRPYWLYDMPAPSLKIGTVSVSAVGIKRTKKQTMNFPVGLSEPNVQQLVKTGLGNGQVQQMSVRLTSRMSKTVLKYDTE